MIKDPFGRPIKNLRIAITQKCNLNCFYCHREGENYSGNTEMTPEEIQRIVRISASQGRAWILTRKQWMNPSL